MARKVTLQIDGERERQREREKERQKGRNTQPSVGSLCHFCATATHLSYRFFIFETSATALRGTTGIFKNPYILMQLPYIYIFIYLTLISRLWGKRSNSQMPVLHQVVPSEVQHSSTPNLQHSGSNRGLLGLKSLCLFFQKGISLLGKRKHQGTQERGKRFADSVAD